MNIYADLFKPEAKKEAVLYTLALIISGSIFLSLCAQISIILPFSPVPVTGQTFGVMIIGVILGRIRGVAAVVLYLLEGSLGLPVFASAKFGMIHLFGPTGGYLFGFIPAVYFVGYFFERGWSRTVLKSLIILTIAHIIIFVCGITWLSLFTGYSNVLSIGFYPFLPGALVKISLATILIPYSLRLFNSKS
jgi:biotin transport system substrate-specific component